MGRTIAPPRQQSAQGLVYTTGRIDTPAEHVTRAGGEEWRPGHCMYFPPYDRAVAYGKASAVFSSLKMAPRHLHPTRTWPSGPGDQRCHRQRHQQSAPFLHLISWFRNSPSDSTILMPSMVGLGWNRPHLQLHPPGLEQCLSADPF